MLDLPNVTLLFVETRAHKITKRVIDDCISRVNFGEILIYTDNAPLIPVAGARYIPVDDFPDKKRAGQFYYQHACAGITTDFALMLEWDAGIFDETKWRPEFLDYDYVGAPWNVKAAELNCLDVGNGGFMLMSKKLGDFLHDRPQEFPVFTDWDVSRTFRPRLEAQGFKWPGRDLAGKFSWELVTRDPDNFGFHGTFTWPWMLSREETIIRAKLMTETPYLLSKMRDLARKAPWLETEIDRELWEKVVTNPPNPPNRPNYNTLSANQRMKMNHIITQRRLLYASQSRPQSAVLKPGLKA